MSAPARPRDPRDRSILPVVASLVVCLGLAAFAIAWSLWQSDCYDDSDPDYYLGVIVLVAVLPGIVVAGLAAVLRVVGAGGHDIWNAICWTVVALYLALAVLVAFEVWSGWDGRVYCGGNPYGD